ncbi:MAG: phospholipase A [Candidatus Thiodiazotropha endolucinida]|uniref:Phospholipase A1 n=1 Tax=Candidatus Thiodiazotropha taylori TaxID=2792791 RepID=A0A9E4TV99_9GAMM|nr:phospholipase A [Candidatus Thiodiazotropha taylori]MCW4237659.1 phospholipase A [Candidatus Thiodiazotropha endolucinida]
MNPKLIRHSLWMALLAILGPCRVTADPLADYERCIWERLQHADDDMLISELKRLCLKSRDPLERHTASEDGALPPVTEQSISLVEKRISAERKTRSNPFVLSPHKQNYVLLASYNDKPNYEVYNTPPSEFDRVEMKFQLSFKMPVVESLFDSRADLYAAYTNLSFWQAYNRDISSPFRETMHEPELFLVVPNDWSLFGWRNVLQQYGVVHQSNGQGGFLSRSWNRAYANFLFERGNFLVGVKPWYRIPEDNDDNPDIDDFLGRYELRGIYKREKQTFSLMLRNLFDGDNRDTMQLDWSFPIHGRWRGYLQYFNGYGESLIDYNAKSHRLGFGLQLTDWL